MAPDKTSEAYLTVNGCSLGRGRVLLLHRPINDDFEVSFDDGDPTHPHNWTMGKKY